MYELLSRQEQLYYYQVPQGEDRAYVKTLIELECRYLIRMLRQRFDAEVTPEKLRAACESLNAGRQSVMDLLSLQQQIPPAAWGGELLAALEENRAIPDRAARTEANRAARERFLAWRSPVPERARRVLITGCPISGVYRKVLELVKQSGGVAVCFENCEGVKAHRRRVDTAANVFVTHRRSSRFFALTQKNRCQARLLAVWRTRNGENDKSGLEMLESLWISTVDIYPCKVLKYEKLHTAVKG